MTKKVQQTQVFLVCDCSGSMAGDAERTMRRLIRETLDVLAAEEAAGNQVFEVQLIPFSNRVVPGPLYVASAVPQAAIENVGTHRPFGGGTALRDAVGHALRQADQHPDIPALVSVFTDGMENASVFTSSSQVALAVGAAERRGNVTITVAGPTSATQFLVSAGVPLANFRPWDGSAAELATVADEHVRSTKAYATTRGTGATRTGSFYADVSKATPSGVRQATKEVSPTDVRTVTPRMGGRSIPDFYGRDFRQGHHYYQLVKPEYVQDDKELVIKIKATGEYRIGSRAVRSLMGLPEVGKIRLHPSTNNSAYEVYVRSDSPNRKVVAGQVFLTID